MSAGAKSVVVSSIVMFKTPDLRFQIVRGRRQVVHGRTTSRAWTHQSCIIASQVVARLVVLLILPPDDRWCDQSPVTKSLLKKVTSLSLSSLLPYKKQLKLPLLCYSVTPLLRYSVTPLLRYSVTLLLRYSVTPLLRYSATIIK